MNIMKYLSILNSSFAVTVVAVGCFTLLLDPCCLAAAINDEGLLLSVSLPFNDLLPPLSDADFEKEKTASSSSIINTASTVKPTDISKTTKRPPAIPAPVGKPTKSLKNAQAKKLQQQQQQQKNKPHLQKVVPALDLNPEVAPGLLAAEEVVAAVKVTSQKQAASTQHSKLSTSTADGTVQTEKQMLQQQSKPQKSLKQQQKQELVKHLQQQTVAHHKLQSQQVSKINKLAQTNAQTAAQVPRQVSVEQLQQLLHPTTSRPSRGALPTLTPFPRRVK